MSAEIINGRLIAEKVRTEIKEQVKDIKIKYKKIPNITTIKVGNDPGSNLYLKLRDKACNEVGINSEHVEFPESAKEKEIICSIKELNENNLVHGILIQLPVPKQISQKNLINSLDPIKDVEGLHPQNIGRTFIGDENIIPITPLSVLTILEHEKIKLKGKDIAIVNHSNLVGKPLASLFLNRNATISVSHVFTKDFKSYTSKADILVTATGIAKIIKSEHVKNGAFVIDVGIVKTTDGICGDVDFEAVSEKAGKITPVPGGVGPVTVACSLKNMIKTFNNCIEDK